MIEVTGNLFEYPAAWLCITTNGVIKPGCEAVMGAGVAKEARERWAELPWVLGRHLMEKGNHVSRLMTISGTHNKEIFSFPTKHHWKDSSLMSLIVQSAKELAVLVELEKKLRSFDPIVALPRIGCGQGGLYWPDVKAEVKDILQGPHFVILTP